jgi:hypothetical protein
MGSLQRETVCVALLAGALVAAGAARAADSVTIYRCLGAKGEIALQDRPCPKDARQDVRQMVRPQDAPPRPLTTAAYTPQRPPAIEVRVIHDRDPRPMYECRTPDGETYTNETGIPNSRYVPLWTYGYSGMAGRGRGPGSGPPRPLLLGASTYEQDTCIRLPQNEVCHALHDRRDELGTRIFNSQPTERQRYEREQRAVDDQLASDCSGY